MRPQARAGPTRPGWCQPPCDANNQHVLCAQHGMAPECNVRCGSECNWSWDDVHVVGAGEFLRARSDVGQDQGVHMGMCGKVAGQRCS